LQRAKRTKQFNLALCSGFFAVSVIGRIRDPFARDDGVLKPDLEQCTTETFFRLAKSPM
jgi:hypothetical protein